MSRRTSHVPDGAGNGSPGGSIRLVRRGMETHGERSRASAAHCVVEAEHCSASRARVSGGVTPPRSGKQTRLIRTVRLCYSSIHMSEANVRAHWRRTSHARYANRSANRRPVQHDCSAFPPQYSRFHSRERSWHLKWSILVNRRPKQTAAGLCNRFAHSPISTHRIISQSNQRLVRSSER